MCSNHTIEFLIEGMLDVEVDSKQPLERLRIAVGTRLVVQIVPYVIEGNDGPVEVADLILGNGHISRCVPFGYFRFVEE